MALLPLEAIRDGLRSDPSLYPHSIDLTRQAVLALALDAAAFRAASFLDERILSAQQLGRWTPFAEIGPWMPSRPERALHFIFHAGHVGSTLVSRLLDDVGGVLGLREPLPLRTLAAAHAELETPHALASPAQWAMLRDWMLACWGRGFADTQGVVVKATSSAASICAPLLEASPASRALLLNLRPEPYLATLLAGENSWLDLRGQAQARMQRLTLIAPGPTRPLHALSLGEIAAMSWAVETLTHRAAAERFADRILRVDFDDVLAEPERALRAICGHFGLAASEAYYRGVAASPTLTRYAKAPEHAYSPDLRRSVLADARSRHAGEIRKGMSWLDAFMRQHPAHAAALSA